MKVNYKRVTTVLKVYVMPRYSKSYHSESDTDMSDNEPSPSSSRTASCWVFSITWFAPSDSQSVAHKAFEHFAKKFVYQWERAPSTGALHCQGYVNLKKRSHPKGRQLAKQLSAMGMKGVTCKPASSAGKVRLQQYCMKEETRVAGPWADRPIYMGADLVQVLADPYPWQRTVTEMIAMPPDDRSIHWVHDQGGGIGKSKLVKALCFKKKAYKVPFGTASQIKTAVIARGVQRCYLVNMPRTLGKKEYVSDLISALEEIKDGMVSSGMYGKTQELFMECPHLWVFANCKAPRSMMSRDRWHEWTIDEDMRLIPYYAAVSSQATNTPSTA